MEGNARYVAGKLTEPNVQARIAASSKGQHPMAVILSCLDSMVPVGQVFAPGRSSETARLAMPSRCLEFQMRRPIPSSACNSPSSRTIDQLRLALLLPPRPPARVGVLTKGKFLPVHRGRLRNALSPPLSPGLFLH